MKPLGKNKSQQLATKQRLERKGVRVGSGRAGHPRQGEPLRGGAGHLRVAAWGRDVGAVSPVLPRRVGSGSGDGSLCLLSGRWGQLGQGAFSPALLAVGAEGVRGACHHQDWKHRGQVKMSFQISSA